MESWALRTPVRLLWILGSAVLVTVTDFYLPATPIMAEYFNISRDVIQSVLSAYFISVALAAFSSGYLAERYGKIRIFQSAFILIFIGSLICLFANSLAYIFLGRIIQGLGGGLGGVAILALIRSYYPGEYAAKILAQTGMVFISAPFAAQWIGGQLTLYVGWQACFGASAVLSLAFLLLSNNLFRGLHLKEREEKREKPEPPIKISSLLSEYAALLKNKKGISLLLIQPLILGGIWCYRSSLPFILMETFSVPLEVYSYYLVPLVVTHLIFSFIAQKLVVQSGSRKLIQFGVIFLFTGGFCELSLFMFDLVTPVTLTIAFLPFVAGYSFSLSTSMATGIGRFKLATFASSLTVCMRMMGGAFGGACAGYFNESSILGLTLFILCAALTAQILFLYSYRQK